MAKTSELEDLSTKELRALRDRIDVFIAQREKTDRVELKAKMVALAEEAGMSLDDILGGARARGTRAPVAIKYRNPENTEETWTGRGRKPNWLTAKLTKRGAAIEDFAV